MFSLAFEYLQVDGELVVTSSGDVMPSPGKTLRAVWHLGPFVWAVCQSLRVLAWLGVSSSLSGKVPSESSNGGVAAFIAVLCLECGCRHPLKTKGVFPCSQVHVFFHWKSAIQLRWGARVHSPVWIRRWNLDITHYLHLFTAEQLQICFFCLKPFSRYLIWAFIPY